MSRFAIRIERDQLPRLVEMLRAIPPERVTQMRAELAKVHPVPCTLHPAPCTLHLAPCTQMGAEFAKVWEHYTYSASLQTASRHTAFCLPSHTASLHTASHRTASPHTASPHTAS